MKIFYFGSVCSDEKFNETVARSRTKPSASAQNFENALIKGFSANDIDLTVASAESIATFPNGNRIFLEKRKDFLAGNVQTSIVPAINLPFVKQYCHALGAEKLLKKWLHENESEPNKCVLVYGIYPTVVHRLQQTCRQHSCKIFAVVTDIPATMFTYTKSKNFLKRLFSGSYRKSAVAVQDKFDGYIYLTEAMADEVAQGKPYIVVETIADTSIFDNIETVQKSSPPALMYAGALYKKYGVDLIIDVFEKVKTNCELWLFGSGDFEGEIQKRAESNARIKFFGRMSRQEVLKCEKKASLLINIRDDKDVYTQYSFPSKMIEYMLSGTPLLTTKLSGIPDEYYSYCYVAESRDEEKIAEQIEAILNDPEMDVCGKRAKRYVEECKNSSAQTESIIHFLKEHI